MVDAPSQPGSGDAENSDPGGWPGLQKLNDLPLGQCALIYARAGLPVFPVFGATQGVDGTWRCECGDAACQRPAKHPRVRWVEEATTDETMITGWWSRWPHANLGLPTGSGPGRSGLVAVDLDVDEEELEDGTVHRSDGEDELRRYLRETLSLGWPETLEQRTAGGGKHLLLRDPGAVTTGSRWLPGVDLRGDAGYILLAPSRGIKNNGATYAWLNERSPVVPVEVLGQALRVARGSARRGPGGDHSASAPGYDYTTAKREGPPRGARDEFFNTYAFELRKAGVSREAAEAELHRTWELGRERWPPGDVFPWETALGKLRRVYATVEPEGGEGSSMTEVPAERGAQVIDLLTRQPAPPSGGSGGGGGGRRVEILNEPPAEGLTDLGNAVRFSRLFRGRVHYAHGLGWLVWNGAYWQPDGTDLVVHLVKEVIADLRREALDRTDDTRAQLNRWATETEGAGRIRALLSLAQGERSVALTAGDLDTHPHLLCCPNGTLDLRTGDLGEHRPEHLITRQTAVPFDPVAESELLTEFEELFLPDPEEREYVYRVLGSALWGGNRFRLFPVILGGTTSGKSTLTDLVMAALGEYAVPVNASVYRGTLDDKARPDLLRALPARLAVAEETSSALELHSDQLKRLTGGDKIVARRMRSDTMIERKPDFTPLIVTNAMPHVKDADAAIRRRLTVLRFGVSLDPSREDPEKKPALVLDTAARTALLARLVRGEVAARERGVSADQLPLGFAEATMQAFTNLDDVARFIEFLVDEGRLESYVPETVPVSQCVPLGELHAEYGSWIRKHGSADQVRNRLTVQQFNRRLEAAGWRQQKSGSRRWAGKILKFVATESWEPGS